MKLKRQQSVLSLVIPAIFQVIFTSTLLTICELKYSTECETIKDRHSLIEMYNTDFSLS